MRPRIFLQNNKQSSIWRGHPWIFPKAILRSSGQPKTGELVDIMTANNEYWGVGAYNEHSLYRVRVLALQHELKSEISFATIIQQRLTQALQLRQALNLPNAATTAYRLLNSEGDGLSGLTIDRFNHTCVIASSAFWVESQKQEIMACLQRLLPDDQLLWLAQTKPLQQDGWRELIEPSILTNDVQVSEAGILYQVNFTHMQKTGLFLDQRENHQRIAALAQGKRVLDLYSYSGGFALHAARGGATQVTAVDSSAQAIQMAQHNIKLNQLDSIQLVEADARDYLSAAKDYDLIILDPPKLVPSQRHIERAKNYYRFLHREIFKAMRPGSLLMTCNCSAALNAQEFTTLVSAQAMSVGKTARILGIFGPASCHPVLVAFPEGQYLTAVLLAIM